MIVLAIISLSFTVVLTRTGSLLPQARLKSSSKNLASRLEQSRLHALLYGDAIVFSYDLDRHGYEAYYPFERGEQGEYIGPGKTPVFDFRRLEDGIEFREIRLPDADPRTSELVALPISALGRMSPHEVVVHNPEHPEREVMTIRISGLKTGYDMFRGSPEFEIIDDSTFR
jgi:hypothetical protein